MNAFNCPKCNRYGFVWDARAKILMCSYETCRHIVRIENQREIPSNDVIQAAIDADKNGESIGKAVRGVMKSDKQWDAPKYDSTDWAHPAWFRGTLRGLQGATRLIENIISGKETGAGAMYEDADKLRQMVLGLKWKYDAMCKARVDWIKRSSELQNERDSLAQERDSLHCDVERLEQELIDK